jgi:nicotinate-nucleotide adenylyltransferase
MLKLAIAPIQGCRIIDWELKESGPSYAIKTVRTLAEDPSLELHLLLGEDQIDAFLHWKEADELIRLAPPLIGSRNMPQKSKEQPLPGKRVKIPLFDISSTLIRERLAQKKYCGHLIPASTLDYIAQHHLYLKT